MDISQYRIWDDPKFKLSDMETHYTGKTRTKEEADQLLSRNVERMAEAHEMLYAQDKYALLIIIQGMDTSGKDGTIKHVMSGLNPQGTRVHSFKQPSSEELDHDFLWRIHKCLPERGQIGIFNRSYYEDVLVVKVHNLHKVQGIPQELIGGDFWKQRYKQIRNYEQYLYDNGIIPVKIMLHISKEEQKNRLLARIEDKSKNWKFSAGDVKERACWEQYQKCYQDLIRETAVKHAPWYVVPADDKWYARLVVSEIIAKTLKKLDLKFPELDEAQLATLEQCKQQLLNEEP